MQIMWSRSTETYSYYGFFYASYDIQGTKQRSNNNNRNTLYLGKNKTYDINRKLQTNAPFPFEMLFSILQVIFFLVLLFKFVDTWLIVSKLAFIKGNLFIHTHIYYFANWNQCFLFLLFPMNASRLLRNGFLSILYIKCSYILRR